MEISRNQLNRFEVKGIQEQGTIKKGIAGYHGGFWAVIGWIVANILHKAVPIKTSKGVYYLNCKSLENWMRRVAPGSAPAGNDKAFSKKMHDPDAVARMIESITGKPQAQFINKMTDAMKSEFKNINEVSAATCFVKITKDGQSNVRQYIFANEDNSPFNKTDFASNIDKIGKNLTKEASFVHSIEQQWVIISKLPNGEFYIADGNRSVESKKTSGIVEKNEGEGGSVGGSRNMEGLKVALFRLKEMGIETKPIFSNNKFVSGPHFKDLTPNVPKTNN